jgi:HAD superfamily hydrolase (TIGR01509 family)
MRMPPPKAILWDMDGILADTTPLHFSTWEQILREEAIPFDKQQFQKIYGLKNHDLLPFLAGKPMESQRVERISARKELAFRQKLAGNLIPLPGVVDWLKRFQSWGCKQAVASSAPPENVEALVDELAIRHYFDALVTPGHLPGKPDPAVFLLAARQLEVPPKKCLVIEDSIPGLEAARRAKMRCLAVSNTNPPQALQGADIVIETMSQLTEKQILALF